MRRVLVIVALLIPATAAAETYHVAPGGSDGAAGSQAAPWATLQHAAETVAPGDIVRVRAGEYAGFNLETSGRDGAEIAFIADAGARVTLPAPGRREGINLEGVSFVRVEGFFVTGAPFAGIRTVSVPDQAGRPTARRVTLRGNHVDQNRVFNILTGFVDDLLIENNETSRAGEQHGIYVSNSGDRPIVRGNKSWGNNQSGIQLNGDRFATPGDGIISGALVEANVIFDNGVNGGSALNCDGVQDSVFRNNLVYDNHATGMALYRIDGGGPSTGNLVVNNTFSMASDADAAITVQDASTANRFRNNILLHAGTGEGAFDMSADSVAGTQSDHNMGTARFNLGGQFVDLAAWRTRTSLDTDFAAATAAALFSGTGTAPADFLPREGGPAIDKGSATDAPNVDLAGNGRPQGAGIDVGALERCTGTCMPPPPPPVDAGPGGSRPDAGSGGNRVDAGPNDPDAGPGGAIESETITGGCCQTGSGSGASSLLLGLGVLAVATGRRRRARPRSSRG